MAEKIVITGRVPSKKNSRSAIPMRGRCILIPQKNYTLWHRDASLQLPKIKIDEILELTILFYFPDNRRTDLSNKAESIMDLLVDNGVLEDDNWNVVPRLILESGGKDSINPRVEITWLKKPKNKNA